MSPYLTGLLDVLGLCLFLAFAVPGFGSGPQANFAARPEADPMGNVDVKWFSRAGGVYEFQFSDSLTTGQWTSLFSAYAAETTDMAVRVWNAPPVSGGPPPPEPARPKDYGLTLVRNGPQTLVMWKSSVPNLGMVRMGAPKTGT